MSARLRWAVALMLGVRQGEALGLRWEHVTLERDEDRHVVGGVVELAWALSRIPARVKALPAGTALGVDEATRMQILGHSSATTTRGYTHADLTLARAGMDQYAALLGL